MGLKQYNNIVSSESLSLSLSNISTEYYKIDWWAVFGGLFNQLYRLFNRAETTTINHPSLLLYIFLDQMTMFNGLNKFFSVGRYKDFLAKIKDVKNPYYYIIAKQMKDIDVANEAVYKEWENNVKQLEELIDYSIKNVCTSIPERPLELTEKNVLKLYDLEKFSKEVKSSLDVINNKLQKIEDNVLAKKWQSLVERLVECSKKAFDYVGKNIYMQ